MLPPAATARFPDTPPGATGTVPARQDPTGAGPLPPALPPRPTAPPADGPEAPRSERREGADRATAPAAAPAAVAPPAPADPPKPAAPPGSTPAPPAVPPTVGGPPRPPVSGTRVETGTAAPARPAGAPTPPAAAPRTGTGRRAVGAVDLTPGPTGRPFVPAGRPEQYDDSTTRLRPVRSRGTPRIVAAAVCAVLGLGLVGGAAAGTWLTGDSDDPSPARSFAAAGGLWHTAPVDRLFPPVLHGDGAGPGGADRTWTRIAVAPDGRCSGAFDPLLAKVLAPVGCTRLLRATYTDATRSHLITVGMLFTEADPAAMSALRGRFVTEGLAERTDLMPRAYAAPGTLAASFDDAQRASWTVSVLTDAPVVVYAVSGFADGRTISEPQPADKAMRPDATTAPAQAGLGHDAKGIADRVERGLRKDASSPGGDGA
ncbi:hypothetical protein [Streptomyces sp. NPDC050560]|uniref:hypothetical protein n=1 Tax=Streptomyces sp. NPDC050560 TaxID=3365630 RepID=UPI0037A2AA54